MALKGRLRIALPGQARRSVDFIGFSVSRFNKRRRTVLVAQTRHLESRPPNNKSIGRGSMSKPLVPANALRFDSDAYLDVSGDGRRRSSETR